VGRGELGTAVDPGRLGKSAKPQLQQKGLFAVCGELGNQREPGGQKIDTQINLWMELRIDCGEYDYECIPYRPVSALAIAHSATV